MGKTREQVKLALKRFADKTAIHGLGNLSDASLSTRFRITTGIAFLVAFSACGYLIFKLLHAYFLHEVVTLVEIVPEENGIQFPDVVFCELNPFTNNETIRIMDESKATPPSPKNGTMIELMSNYSFASTIFMLDYSGTVLRMPNITRNPINETVLSCLYDFATCSVETITFVFHPLYGNCYQFSTDLKLTGTGQVNGLRLDFILEPVKSDFVDQTGLQVIVRNKNEILSPWTGIPVSTGARTAISLSKIVNQKLPSPYSKCRNLGADFDSKLFQNIRNSNQTYSQRYCRDLCLGDRLFDFCSCQLSLLPIFGETVPICESSEQLSCQVREFNILKSDYARYCDHLCPLECESTSYTLSTSAASFPTDGYVNLLTKNIPFIREKYPNVSLKENLLSVHLYFPEMTYTRITETAKYEIIDLVAGIGGYMGLMIGASIFSLFEIAKLSLEIMKALLCHKRPVRQKKRKVESPKV